MTNYLVGTNNKISFSVPIFLLVKQRFYRCFIEYLLEEFEELIHILLKKYKDLRQIKFMLIDKKERGRKYRDQNTFFK